MKGFQKGWGEEPTTNPIDRPDDPILQAQCPFEKIAPALTFVILTALSRDEKGLERNLSERRRSVLTRRGRNQGGPTVAADTQSISRKDAKSQRNRKETAPPCLAFAPLLAKIPCRCEVPRVFRLVVSTS